MFLFLQGIVAVLSNTTVRSNTKEYKSDISLLEVDEARQNNKYPPLCGN